MSGDGGGADGEREQGVGDAVGGVAEDVALCGEVARDAVDAEGFDAIDVGDGGFGALGGVAFAKLA